MERIKLVRVGDIGASGRECVFAPEQPLHGVFGTLGIVAACVFALLVLGTACELVLIFSAVDLIRRKGAN